MASLPNNTFASPGNPFFAFVGAGGGGGGGTPSSLQSPATILPAPDGTISLRGDTPAGSNAPASIALTAGNGFVGDTGQTSLFLSSPNKNYINFYDPTDTGIEISCDPSTQPNVLNISDSATNTVASFNTVANAVNLLSPLGVVGGSNTAYINGTAIVTSSATRPAPSGITLLPTSPTISNILNTCASGGALIFGSSQACTSTVGVVDTIGAGTAFVSVNSSGSQSLRLQGGTLGNNIPIIATNSANSGTLVLAPSAANQQVMYIRDGLTADTGYVDVTAGSGNYGAVRLTGAPAANPLISTVSTNSATGGGGILNLTTGYNDSVTAPAIQIADNGITTFRQIGMAGAGAPLAGWTAPGVGQPVGTPYIVLKAAGVSNGVFTVDLSPLQTGWAMVYGGVTPGQTPASNDQTAMFSVMVYTTAGNTLIGGGVGGVPGLVTVQPTGTTSLSVNIAVATTANYVIYGMMMWGN